MLSTHPAKQVADSFDVEDALPLWKHTRIINVCLPNRRDVFTSQKSNIAMTAL